MKKEIMITGVSGFVGSNLAPYLSDYNIVGVSRKRKPNSLLYQELAVSHFDKLHALIHLAGKAHDLVKGNDDQYNIINVNLTIKLFDFFLKSKCEIFIFMSSVKAIADTVENELKEDCVALPKTAYGKSKLKAEKYILSKNIPGNKKVYILRPCMTHGPNNRGNLNLLYKFVKKGYPFPLGNYTNKRSYLSVNNLCYIVLKLLTIKPKSGVFNLADDEALSINETVKCIGMSIGKEIKIIKVPISILNFIAYLGSLFSLPINKERLEKLTQNYCVSNAKIKSIIGDLPISSKEGLALTMVSFLKNEK